MLPDGTRPLKSSPVTERPEPADDNLMLAFMDYLKSPYREILFLQNRSGMRPGECRGLRLSDLRPYVDMNGKKVIRVRYSDDGPLKEDKKTKKGPSPSSEGKYPPRTDDFDSVVGPIIEARRAEGAQDEDYVFAPRLKRATLKAYAERAVRAAAEALGDIPHRQYDAGRHTMATRNLDKNPNAMPEVSKALGHHSVTTTEGHYDHRVIPCYTEDMRAPLKAKLRSVK
jgi:integrase